MVEVIKICGLQSTEGALVALRSCATHVGIICVPGRKRTVDADTAKAISYLIREGEEGEGRLKTKLVGVFKDQGVDEVKSICESYGLDVVQLHGSEDWQLFRAELPANMAIIKRFVFPRDCDRILEMCSKGQNCFALLDTEEGGTGELLDWKEIGEWSRKHDEVKFVLAGGLTPENVGEALKVPGVCGVDVSGGVETDGVKDVKKIEQFISSAAQDRTDERLQQYTDKTTH
ncbi:phosphoribosylanthranilate isomerase TRP1 Ecym_5310 [Eremothecium cymbalariae DBVPG|uniref:N-(5'-phosphoribosyl)anthranilate isomerase n=1 Tax=Eremothecium cymbalariae (strain CBS 270.75 / DBVPG 7215 / KCTC 17166 / NRRL Y-17582) TaxID=931890 RepID=I6NDC9_ERECY|nr:hypothetical protein Ecym_5310 [Eremothecium cymbalariae DBVPG\